MLFLFWPFFSQTWIFYIKLEQVPIPVYADHSIWNMVLTQVLCLGHYEIEEKYTRFTTMMNPVGKMELANIFSFLPGLHQVKVLQTQENGRVQQPAHDRRTDTGLFFSLVVVTPVAGVDTVFIRVFVTPPSASCFEHAIKPSPALFVMSTGNIRKWPVMTLINHWPPSSKHIAMKQPVNRLLTRVEIWQSVIETIENGSFWLFDRW
jgi:hypothetical protein